MKEWTNEATEYLEGYLKQVSALAKNQGEDADDIVNGLRDHIANEMGHSSGDVVDIDTLFAVLAKIGTPEEVVNLDSPLASPRVADNTKESVPVPPPTPPSQQSPPQQFPPQQVVVKHRSLTGCALAAIVFPIVALIMIAVIGVLASILLPALSRAREAARRAECAGHLKQFALGLRVYAEEHDNSFPPMSDEPGRIMVAADTLFPKFVPATEVFICPSNDISSTLSTDESFVDDHAYYFISHVLESEEEGLAFVAAYQEWARTGESMQKDITTEDGLVLRLISNDTEDADPAKIPVMIEKPDHHVPTGGNVLYLDGHVEFIRLDERFPMTTKFIDALNVIDR
jgi:prepilin-type processing-associated H-X9-DG protein